MNKFEPKNTSNFDPAWNGPEDSTTVIKNSAIKNNEEIEDTHSTLEENDTDVKRVKRLSNHSSPEKFKIGYLRQPDSEKSSQEGLELMQNKKGCDDGSLS